MMIHVRLDESMIPAGWLDRAKRLTEELCAIEDPTERKTFIKRHQRVWSEIKDALLRMSYGKCWYSEAPDAVSDWHVDHFRPKSRTVDFDGTEHEGYSWLAFDWHNYRLCGSFPNSPHKDEEGEVRGKRDLFPLLPGSKRACWEDRDCNCEQCLLLDPADENDPNLITFDEEGTVKPSRPNAPIVAKRVETTAEILYLDAPRLLEARKRTWRECAELVEELLSVMPARLEDIDQLRWEQIKRMETKIRRRTQPQAPYSAVARACLRAHGLGDLIATPETAAAARSGIA